MGTAAARPARARPLAELTAGLVDVPPTVLVSDLTLDSRSVSPGALFLACRGRTHHGIEFARQAVEQGARAILYECSGDDLQAAPELGPDVFVAGVPQLGSRVGEIADRFFGEPSRSIRVAGVTGTNGKTTCAWLLAQALNYCGRPAAYAGTVGYGRPGALVSSEHTTADAVTVHRRLAQLRDEGVECVAMEVSSHALDQSRVAGVRFRCAVFTNLTRDHLDYHGTMQAYGEAKARLLAWPTLAERVINVDDAFGLQLAGQPSAARLVVTSRRAGEGDGLPDGKYVRARGVQMVPGGMVISVESSWGAADVSVRLLGEFNADNVLSVLAVLLAWDVPLAEAARALGQCTAAPGRMEAFGGRGSAPLAIVDYAHTPDALANALRAARSYCRGRLRVVFGCGGDRDRGKRALMGRVAGELADEIVLTDDNPRSEDPQHIVADILGGIERGRSVSVEHDRARAIRATLRRSGPADVVLIAGKGHEDYQIYGAERRPFSDQEIVRSELGGQA